MEGTTAGIQALLDIVTVIAAFFWEEVGLFANFCLEQPLLALSFGIPIVSLIVGFFFRIFGKARG